MKKYFNFAIMNGGRDPVFLFIIETALQAVRTEIGSGKIKNKIPEIQKHMARTAKAFQSYLEKSTDSNADLDALKGMTFDEYLEWIKMNVKFYRGSYSSYDYINDNPDYLQTTYVFVQRDNTAPKWMVKYITCRFHAVKAYLEQATIT